LYLRSFYFVLAVFVLAWVLFFKPYEVHGAKRKDPALLFSHFRFKELDENGTRIDMTGEYGIYENEKIFIKNLFVRDADGSETIRAERGSYFKDVLTLERNVRYLSREYAFTTQKALYAVKEGILRVPGRFWLFAREYNVTGVRLSYYKTLGTIRAYDIKAKALMR